ncbi:siderophore-interacting protein [Aeromicrobium sp. CTD01-1L150]|uniref:siderophore-interacting protein n=1 Tax=Aeromicrobium sp. CTD01-1L150 TaxID=3341830 RepID=UPI0035C008C5
MSKNRPARLSVLRNDLLTPTMRRLVLGDVPGETDQLDAFAAGWTGSTDSYVKLVFLAVGHTYPEPLDLAVIRETMPPQAWPILRTYTVRRFDPEARELWVDFVVHGDEGVAGPWAAQAEPGETIHVRGPGGAYRPDPEADHHLLVGDEAALPAITASLESLSAGSRATAFLEVAGPEEEQPVSSDADVDLRWLHRDGAQPGTTTLLDDAVRAWEWPAGRVQVFVHGEAGLLSSVRPYLMKERGVARADASISAYWRHGDTEESFREWKSQQSEPILRPGG